MALAMWLMAGGRRGRCGCVEQLGGLEEALARVGVWLCRVAPVSTGPSGSSVSRCMHACMRFAFFYSGGGGSRYPRQEPSQEPSRGDYFGLSSLDSCVRGGSLDRHPCRAVIRPLRTRCVSEIGALQSRAPLGAF